MNQNKDQAYLLAIEANCRNGIKVLVEFKAVEGSSLAGGIEAEHDNV